VTVNLSVDTSSLCIINIPFILNYTIEKRYRLILMTLTFAGCYLSEVKHGWFVLLLRWTLETTNRSAICVYHKGKRKNQGSLCSWICQSNAYELNIVTAVTFFCGGRNPIHMWNSQSIIFSLIFNCVLYFGVHSQGKFENK